MIGIVCTVLAPIVQLGFIAGVALLALGGKKLIEHRNDKQDERRRQNR